jgi:hypothetical protein
MPVDGGQRYRRVVDDPVDDHFRHFRLHRNRIRGDRCDFPGQLLNLGQTVLFRVDADGMQFHLNNGPQGGKGARKLANVGRGCKPQPALTPPGPAQIMRFFPRLIHV